MAKYFTENQSSDYLWFKENRLRLFKEYGICYIVIQNKKILNTYESYGEALHNTLKKEKPGRFIIQFCDGK